MNISGYSDINTHDGNTTIIGDLQVDGNVFVNNALGQSEYLDAGTYSSIISNINGITNVSFDSVTRTYYEKQGNLIKLYVSLKITFTTSLSSSFTFDMTVPALDIFEKKINGTYCIANGGFVNQYDADGFANVIDTNGTIRVIFQRLPPSTVALPFSGDAYGSVILIYKLEGEDIPASVLIAGGTGTGNVSNPMLETLDGGGFNIVNVDTIVATNITAPNVVTNPLSTNLNANNQNILNINSVDATILNATNTNTSIISTDTINSLVASDVTFSNNINMGTRNINNVGELKVTTLSATDGKIITAGESMSFNNNNIFQLGNLQTQSISSQVGEVKYLNRINMNDNIIKGCNELNSQNGDLIIKGLTSGGTFPASKISLEAFKVDLSQCPNGLDMGNHPINNAGIITANELRVYNINGVNGNDLNITNVDNPVVITGSKIELRSNPPNTGKVEFYTGIDMDNKNIENVQNIITQRVLGKAGTALVIDSAVGYTIDLKDDTNIEGSLNVSNILKTDTINPFNTSNILIEAPLGQAKMIGSSKAIVESADDVEIICDLGSNIRLTNNLTLQGSTIYLDSDTGTIDVQTADIINVGDLKLSKLRSNTGLIEQYATRVEEHTNILDKVDTVHIYDASGFSENVVSISGNDYYVLLSNVTYIIHDQITVTNGFAYGVNTAIRGESVACSITFDESTKDICGFRSEDQHLFLSDITIIGGGGHFTSSTANVKGLFDFSNFNTGAPAPFYGRNKRCRIQNVQVIAPYSLGKLQGGGTIRLLGNFINGGGAQPTGIYTRVGLDVSDGLSFELCNNKVVLFAGAQVASTLKMFNFVDAIRTPVVLGFNAVIISGNIFHPRDEENAINFENYSITQLGTIGSNTFIRTGGVAPLINYERATINNNFNKSAVINYEVNGNAGVLDVLPTGLINATASNSISSATYTDITFPIGNIKLLNGTKRFGLKSFVTGVVGGNYTTGNYIRDSADANKFAYILDAELVLGGTNKLILEDFNGFFNSATNYEEIDKDFVLTGVTSTGFNFGTTSNNEIELYYGDKDPADLQITSSITHTNTTTNDEVQFIMAFDNGAGYVEDIITTVNVTNPRPAPRSNTSTITTLKRFVKGDLFKFLYRYVDPTISVVDNITITVH